MRLKLDRCICKAAFVLGLFSSTYSALFITLGSGRIGRDPVVDWMQVGTAYFGKGVISMDPGLGAIAAGIFVHQSADILWAFVFFCLMWGVTGRLNSKQILLLVVPWAVITATIEYYLTLQWLQPLVPMQVPFWTAFMVHIISGMVYPVFPIVRNWFEEEKVSELRFARPWAGLLVVLLAGISVLYIVGKQKSEMEYPFIKVTAECQDAQFLRRMTAHHMVGLKIAELAAKKATTEELATFGELVYAEHEGEVELMRMWWGSWFEEPMPDISEDTWQNMVGMPPPDLIYELENTPNSSFEVMFLEMMLRYHEGAVVMCNRIMGNFNDPRVYLLAESIRHAQLNQMEYMRELLRERTASGAATVSYNW